MDNRNFFTGSARTKTICPQCNNVVEAWLYTKSGDVWIKSDCPEHGNFDNLYFKDAELFQNASRFIDYSGRCEDPDCAHMRSCNKHPDRTYNIMVNLTQRCNMGCPVCFADTDKGRDWPEPTPDEIYERLPKISGSSKPNVVFIGGEPTLRDDLPEIISGVAERGFLPRLSTNGLKLLDQDYTDSLARAGLYWIVLQFDGVQDRVYEDLRGCALLEDKKKILHNCEKAGISVQLAVMVDRERNGSQIGRIIDFAFDTPNIKWVNFYPRTGVNRYALDDGEDLHMADMIDLFCSQIDHKCRTMDFLTMMRVLNRIYKVTGIGTLRQKLSTWPMVIMKTSKGIVPLPKLLSPSGIARNREAVLPVFKNLHNLWNFQKMKMPPEFLFITVEKFHNRNAIDLAEASSCHMAYMIRDGFVPFDIYNCLYRDRPNW